MRQQRPLDMRVPCAVGEKALVYPPFSLLVPIAPASLSFPWWHTALALRQLGGRVRGESRLRISKQQGLS